MRSESSHSDASEPVASLIICRPQRSGEVEFPCKIRQSIVKETLFPRGDVCCTRQQTGYFCADPFLSIPAVRHLSAGKGVGRSASSSGSPRGEEGGKIRSNSCAHGAREARRRRRCIAIVEKFAATVARTERARREGGGSHLCGGESVQGTLGCAQGTRGGRLVRSDLEWQGGAQTPNGLVVCPTVLGVGWSVKARWTLTMGLFLLRMLAGLLRGAGAIAESPDSIAARHRARSTGTQPSGCSLCTRKCAA